MGYNNTSSTSPIKDSNHNDLVQLSLGLNPNLHTDAINDPNNHEEGQDIPNNQETNVILNANASAIVLPDSDKSRLADVDVRLGFGLPTTGRAGWATKFHTDMGYGLTNTNRQRKKDTEPMDHDGIILHSGISVDYISSPGNYSQMFVNTDVDFG